MTRNLTLTICFNWGSVGESALRPPGSSRPGTRRVVGRSGDVSWLRLEARLAQTHPDGLRSLAQGF